MPEIQETEEQQRKRMNLSVLRGYFPKGETVHGLSRPTEAGFAVKIFGLIYNEKGKARIADITPTVGRAVARNMSKDREWIYIRGSGFNPVQSIREEICTALDYAFDDLSCESL